MRHSMGVAERAWTMLRTTAVAKPSALHPPSRGRRAATQVTQQAGSSPNAGQVANRYLSIQFDPNFAVRRSMHAQVAGDRADVRVRAHRSLQHPLCTFDCDVAPRHENGENNMVYITAVRMGDGNGHEHIASFRWRNPTDGNTGSSTKAVMVDWIDNENGVAKVQSTPEDVMVGTVDGTPKYLRTYANGKWTDNLLALPRF